MSRSAFNNIVLVTVDSLRPDHLGCYGCGKPTSPALDRFARAATVFENVWAGGPSTPFSFPGLMASRMPFQSSAFGVHGVPVTMAEVLRDAGYRTRGYVAANPFVSHYFGYDRGFDELIDFLEFFRSDNVLFRYLKPDERTGTRGPSAGRSAFSLARSSFQITQRIPVVRGITWRMRRLWRDRILNSTLRGDMRAKHQVEGCFQSAVLDWIRRAAAEPFFLWLHLMTVHDPYCPPPECQRAVGGRSLSERRVLHLRRLSSVRNQVDGPPLQDADLRDLMHLYDAEVRRADAFLGQVFEALEERGLRDGSLTIVTADHGEQFMEHGRLAHPSMHYDELLRVPLIVRLPRQEEARRVNEQVALADVLPTVAEMIGVRLPEGACTGRSFAPLLKGESPGDQPHRLHVAESFIGRDETLDCIDWQQLWLHPRRVSFANDAVKLIVDCATGRCRAYDRRADPQELRDLALERPELAQVGRQLARLHVRHCERRRLRRIFPEGPLAAGRRGR